jgi:hypothetical protein
MDDAPERPLPRLECNHHEIAFPARGANLFLRLSELSPTDSDGDAEGVWIFRAEAGMCGLIPGTVRVVRGGIRIAGLAILHHGDSLQIGAYTVRFVEIRTRVLDAGSRLIGKRCINCRSRFESGVELSHCPYCNEPYHQDCWAALAGKKCHSRNCRFSPGQLDP